MYDTCTPPLPPKMWALNTISPGVQCLGVESFSFTVTSGMQRDSVQGVALGTQEQNCMLLEFEKGNDNFCCKTSVLSASNFQWNLARTIFPWGKCMVFGWGWGSDCEFIIRYAFLKWSFKSFWSCLSNSGCGAPVVYLLTMYVCFMKLFNLQFTFLQR